MRRGSFAVSPYFAFRTEAHCGNGNRGRQLWDIQASANGTTAMLALSVVMFLRSSYPKDCDGEAEPCNRQSAVRRIIKRHNVKRHIPYQK
jgi:hypothetical protein